MKLITLLVLLLTATLYAEKPAQIRYQVYDLGIVDNKLAEPLLPHINQNGLVIGNKDAGAFTWQKNRQEYCPKVNEGRVQFHAVNAHNDVLVSIVRPNKVLEWAIWPSGGQCEESKRVLLETKAYRQKAKKMCLHALSDNKITAGCFINQHGESQVLALSNGSKQVPGIYQGMTPMGVIYGFLEQDSECIPAIWSEVKTVVGIKNYRTKIVPEGIIRPETLAMTSDGVVYGSYWVEYKDANPIVLGAPKVYYNFAWKPSTDEFKLLNIDGMRVKKVNTNHTLIGDLNGKPAICEGGKKPVELTKLLHADQTKEWEILKISDINDRNDLVGIGKYRGETHLFFAERL